MHHTLTGVNHTLRRRRVKPFRAEPPRTLSESFRDYWWRGFYAGSLATLAAIAAGTLVYRLMGEN